VGGKGGRILASNNNNDEVYIGGDGSVGQIVIYTNQLFINDNGDEDNEHEQANELNLFEQISNPKAMLL
jgi:hypothetical protein